ncbi:ArsR family transcriptional regulator [Thermococcus sp.]
MQNDVSFLRSLLNETNIQIISLLGGTSLNTREIARLLQKDETLISRGLRSLEKAGIVEGKWMRVRGKNIKVYSLKSDELKISFSPEGMDVKIGEKSFKYCPPLLESRVPKTGTGSFVGREREVELLKGNHPVAVIFGMAGIGKSSLGARVFGDAFWHSMTGEDTVEYIAWQLALYLNLRGFRAMIEYMRAGGKELSTIRGLALEGITRTEATVVFDDLHKCRDDDVSSMIRFLASRLERGKLILISREKPAISYDERVLLIHLRGLSSEESYRLLNLKMPGITPGEFSRIYHFTLGHPLMLVLVSEASKPMDSPFLFEYLLREVYQGLSNEERTVLQLLSLFDEPVELSALREIHARNIFLTLYSLLNKGLVERTGERYHVHDLLRGFLIGIRDIPAGEYYLGYIRYLLEKNTAKDFLRAFKYAIRLGDRELIGEMTEIRIRRFWRIALDFPLAYQKLLEKIREVPYAREEIARLYFNRGFFEKALMLWLEVREEVEDDFHRFDVLMMLTDVYCEIGEIEKAEECLSELEGLFFLHRDDPYMRLGYYIEVTKVHTFKRERKEAIENAFKELEAIREYPLVHPELESLILYHIGYLYVEMGELEKGGRYYREGLKVAEAYSLPYMENLGYIQIGIVSYFLRDFRTSSESSGKAAEYFLRTKNYRRAIDALFRRAVAMIGEGRFDGAREASEKILELAEGTNYAIGWMGYVLLGILDELGGKSGKEYIRAGLEKIEENEYLRLGMLEELRVLFDEETLQRWLG